MSSRINPKEKDFPRIQKMFKNLNTPWWHETIRYHRLKDIDTIAPIIMKNNRFDGVVAKW